MPNQYVNKVIFGDQTLLDLTSDTVTPSVLMEGYTAHDKSGALIIGTATGGGTGAISVVDTTDTHGGTIRTITAVDISDTTAVAGDVAQGKYFYTADGTKTAGTSTGGGGGSVTQDQDGYIVLPPTGGGSGGGDFDLAEVTVINGTSSPCTISGAVAKTIGGLTASAFEVSPPPRTTETHDVILYKGNAAIRLNEETLQFSASSGNITIMNSNAALVTGDGSITVALV